jgi:hypothetical protein
MVLVIIPISKLIESGFFDQQRKTGLCRRFPLMYRNIVRPKLPFSGDCAESKVQIFQFPGGKTAQVSPFYRHSPAPAGAGEHADPPEQGLLPQNGGFGPKNIRRAAQFLLPAGSRLSPHKAAPGLRLKKVRRQALGIPQGLKAPLPAGKFFIKKGYKAAANPVTQEPFIRVAGVVTPGDPLASKVGFHIRAGKGKKGPQNKPSGIARTRGEAGKIPAAGHPPQSGRAGTPENPHKAQLQGIVSGMGRYKGPRTAAQGLFPQEAVTEAPRRCLDTRTPAPGVTGHRSTGDPQNPAGQAQAGAEGFYSAGVPPAFPGRADTVFHMGNPQGKAPGLPESGQGHEHGAGIRAPRYSRQQSHPPPHGAQPVQYPGFKTGSLLRFTHKPSTNGRYTGGKPHKKRGTGAPFLRLFPV